MKQVSTGHGASISVANVGSSSLLAGSRILRLKNVLHVPILCKNLLSVGQFTRDNAVSFEFHPLLCFVKDIQTRKVLLVGRMHDGFYGFDVSRSSSNKSVASSQSNSTILCAA